ncbi:MAG: HAMP domain-containing histidine kinase [Phycisphaerae bacterium]|nr:HAMP domain-containing histidine kinase [Phycisphaerae bacterium]
MQYPVKTNETAVLTPPEGESETQRLTRELNMVRGQLRHCERLLTVGTMTAMVVHEFNNLLTPIVNYAQMAQRNAEMTPKALDRAIAGGKRAADICRAILGMTRHNSTPETFCLRDMLQETLTAMAREPRRDGIDLSLDVPKDISVTLRRVELQQVLLNLILNARDAVMEHPTPRRIEVSARRRDGLLTLTVTDNGVGIAPEHLSEIFKPFFTTKTQPLGGVHRKGNGLGLALCRDIVEGFGGTLRVRSAPGQGAAFTVQLPV